MTLLYVLIGLAVVYTAYLFGAKKKNNLINKPVHSHIGDTSHEAYKNHKSHGCC